MRRLPKAKDSFKFFKKTPGEIDAMTLSDFSLNRQTDRQAGWPAVRQSRGAWNILPTVDPLCIIRTGAVGGGQATVQSMRLSCSIRLLGISPRPEVTRTTPSSAELNSITWLLRYVLDDTFTMKFVHCKTRVSGPKINNIARMCKSPRPPEKLNTKHGPYLFRFENEKRFMSGLG